MQCRLNSITRTLDARPRGNECARDISPSPRARCTHDPLVVAALLPVVLLVAVGYFAARGKLMSEADTKDLSSLVFVLLIPVLLFRTMSTVHLVQLDFVPITSYFIAVFIFFRHSGGQGV